MTLDEDREGIHETAIVLSLDENREGIHETAIMLTLDEDREGTVRTERGSMRLPVVLTLLVRTERGLSGQRGDHETARRLDTLGEDREGTVRTERGSMRRPSS